MGSSSGARRAVGVMLGVEVCGNLNFRHIEFAGITVWSSGVESKDSCRASVRILDTNADDEML
jgi:hypothetical protein